MVFEELLNANADWSSANESFVSYARNMKDQGIVNHHLPIALINKDLVGVDPHDPNLSPSDMANVALESRSNPFYFFREVMRVPTPGAILVPYKLNRGTFAGICCLIQGCDYIWEAHRQEGRHVFTNAMTLWAMTSFYNYSIRGFGPNETLMCVTADSINQLHGLLPEYLQMPVRHDKDQWVLNCEGTASRYMYTYASNDQNAAINRTRHMGALNIWTNPDYMQFANAMISTGMAQFATIKHYVDNLPGDYPLGNVYLIDHFNPYSTAQFSGSCGFMDRMCKDALMWNDRLIDKRALFANGRFHFKSYRRFDPKFYF